MTPSIWLRLRCFSHCGDYTLQILDNTENQQNFPPVDEASERHHACSCWFCGKPALILERSQGQSGVDPRDLPRVPGTKRKPKGYYWGNSWSPAGVRHVSTVRMGTTRA